LMYAMGSTPTDAQTSKAREALQAQATFAIMFGGTPQGGQVPQAVTDKLHTMMQNPGQWQQTTSKILQSAPGTASGLAPAQKSNQSSERGSSYDSAARGQAEAGLGMFYGLGIW